MAVAAAGYARRMALIRNPDHRPPDTGALAAPVAAGAASGLIAGVPMLALLMTAGAVADDATAKTGVSSSVATMPNAVAQFIFSARMGQFDSDYRWLTYPGIALHLIVAAVLGAVGAALIASLLGRRPRTAPAIVTGIVYGVLLQLLVLYAFVGGLQDVDTVATSVPTAAWWAAHVLYGGLLGAVAAPMMRAGARRADALTTRG